MSASYGILNVRVYRDRTDPSRKFIHPPQLVAEAGEFTAEEIRDLSNGFLTQIYEHERGNPETSSVSYIWLLVGKTSLLEKVKSLKSERFSVVDTPPHLRELSDEKNEVPHLFISMPFSETNDETILLKRSRIYNLALLTLERLCALGLISEDQYEVKCRRSSVGNIEGNASVFFEDSVDFHTRQLVHLALNRVGSVNRGVVIRVGAKWRRKMEKK